MDHFSPNLTNQFQPQRQRLDADWLTTRIQMIFSAYRKDEWSDPEGFIVQLAMNLETYPREVVEYVTDPITGIQTRNKWPPALAEVVDACRAEVEHRNKVAKFSAMPVAPLRLPSPEFSATDNYEAMFKKHGRPFGVFEPERKLQYRG